MLNTGNFDPLENEKTKLFNTNFLAVSAFMYRDETNTWEYVPAQLHDRCVLAAVEVQLSEETVFDVVQHVSVNSVGRTLTLQLEHDHTTVMTWKGKGRDL